MPLKQIHERTIRIRTFETDENKILIEGNLIDERLCRTFTFPLSRISEPKIIHNMTARVELSLPDTIIESISADMAQVPDELC